MNMMIIPMCEWVNCSRTNYKIKLSYTIVPELIIISTENVRKRNTIGFGSEIEIR